MIERSDSKQEGNRRNRGPHTYSRAWLGGCGAWQWSDDVTTSLGLPEGVHDGDVGVAHNTVIPQPGLGVDGFPHAAQHCQAGQVVSDGNKRIYKLLYLTNVLYIINTKKKAMLMAIMVKEYTLYPSKTGSIVCYIFIAIQGSKLTTLLLYYNA